MIREDWSNLSWDREYKPPPEDQPDKILINGQKWSELSDTERVSIENPENCRTLCDATAECYQWQHSDMQCSLGWSVKLGGRKAQEGNQRWTSGWRFSKIGDLEAKYTNCSSGPDWIEPHFA